MIPIQNISSPDVPAHLLAKEVDAERGEDEGCGI
jgi:hypothetical protein